MPRSGFATEEVESNAVAFVEVNTAKRYLRDNMQGNPVSKTTRPACKLDVLSVVLAQTQKTGPLTVRAARA